MDEKIKINHFQDEFHFLSNFYESPFSFNGLVYLTNEHFYQAAKFKSIEEKKRIINLPTPGMTKKAAQKLKKEDYVSNWSEIKLDTMRLGISLKFKENTPLAEMLIATYPIELIEGNWWHDLYWGVCFCKKCNGVGENWLGKILMERRDLLLNK